jgi:hypothetical protein
MTIVMPIFAICLITLAGVFPLQAEVIIEKQGEEEEGVSLKHRRGNRHHGQAPMRIEEPDGTLRPLPSGSIPQSRMSNEGLRDVPDAGGGTMVNVEGRFQSILKVPEGADEAIHLHEPADLQPLKP